MIISSMACLCVLPRWKRRCYGPGATIAEWVGLSDRFGWFDGLGWFDGFGWFGIFGWFGMEASEMGDDAGIWSFLLSLPGGEDGFSPLLLVFPGSAV